MKLTKSMVLMLAALAAVVVTGFVTPAAQAAPRPATTIVDIAVSNPDVTGDGEGDFDILVAAVLAADPAVLRTLSGKGQFTVFAPTDDAFVALLGELGVTADQLLADQELLTEVLLYHVARGNRNSNAVLGSSRIRTMQGGFLFQDGGVLTDANGRTSNIILTDIKASNGVIHVIDTVVLP